MEPGIDPISDPRQYLEGESVLCFKGSEFLGLYTPKEIKLKKIEGKEYTNDVLLDKKIKKFFTPYSFRFGHMLTETLSATLLAIERDIAENKNTTLVVQPAWPAERNNLTGSIKVMSYLVDYFSRTNNVSTIVVPDAETEDEITLVKVVNLEFQPVTSFNVWSMKKVRNFCRSLPEIFPSLGDKRIYLSREKTPDTIQVMFSELSLTRDNPYHFPPNYPRVSNEPELVEYLSKDFRFPVEKVIPEEIESFHEQIKLFSETRLVISPTSSSLFNMLFMPEGSTVIELVTPLTTQNRDIDGNIKYTTSYHNHYSLLSFVCGINYIGLPHNRDVNQIIDKLNRYMF